mmetsp:Transcript_37104/g.86946  ORF Transcript_37104/g.86946 Transcript_37104/m.86946 type:complete len:208 (-) Transcript_37104:429-1052(-)
MASAPLGCSSTLSAPGGCCAVASSQRLAWTQFPCLCRGSRSTRHGRQSCLLALGGSLLIHFHGERHSGQHHCHRTAEIPSVHSEFLSRLVHGQLVELCLGVLPLRHRFPQVPHSAHVHSTHLFEHFVLPRGFAVCAHDVQRSSFECLAVVKIWILGSLWSVHHLTCIHVWRTCIGHSRDVRRQWHGCFAELHCLRITPLLVQLRCSR